MNCVLLFDVWCWVLDVVRQKPIGRQGRWENGECLPQASPKEGMSVEASRFDKLLLFRRGLGGGR